MSEFVGILKYFELQLNSINPNLIQSMNQGIANKVDIELIFKNKNLDATDELIDFYNWKNGIDGSKIALDYRSTFIPSTPFLDLKMMMDYYEVLIEHNIIKKSFFPICPEDIYLMDLDKKSKSYGNIFFYSSSHLILEPLSIFNSLKDMFKSIIACFNEKALSYDKEGYLEINWDLYGKICKKNNPDCDYWRIKY